MLSVVSLLLLQVDKINGGDDDRSLERRTFNSEVLPSQIGCIHAAMFTESCRNLIAEAIGPKLSRVGFRGRYAKREIGTDTMSRGEKLSNATSTLTYSAIIGILLSQSVKRFGDSSLNQRLL